MQIFCSVQVPMGDRKPPFSWEVNISSSQLSPCVAFHPKRYSQTSCRLECSLKAAVSEVGCLPWYVQDQNFIDHKHVKSSGNKGKQMIFSGISLRGLTIIAEHAGI